MKVWIWSILLSLLWVGIILTSGFLVLKPQYRVEISEPYESPNEGSLPGLENWHKRDKGDIHFLLVHGMNHHPLGLLRGAKLPELALPKLAGLLNYEQLSDAFGYWEEYDRHWWEADNQPSPWWQKAGNPAMSELKKRFYANHEIGYDKTRNEITKLAVEANFSEFIKEYCRTSGYDLPPQLKELETNPEAVLRPISYFKSVAEGTGFSAPANLEVPFHILKKDYDALGFLFRLTAKKANAPDVHFHVAVWNIKSCVVKESVFGSWDHFDKERVDTLNELRTAIDPERKVLTAMGGIIPGVTGDYESLVDQHRHTVNRLSKAHYVNWGFGDASIYIKPYGYVFEWAVADALTSMAVDLKEDDRLAIVTESLGSTITLNTINYMLANHETMESNGFRIRHISYPLYVDPTKEPDLRKRDEVDRAQKLESLHNLHEFFHYSADRSPEPKTAIYMFANQFGMIQAGAEQTQKFRTGDLSLSLNESLDYLDKEAGGLDGRFLNRINEAQMTDSQSPYLTVALEDIVNSALGERAQQMSPEQKTQLVKEMSIRMIPDYMRETGSGPREGLRTLGKSKHADQILIASFHDPDDLLGFPLPNAGSKIRVFNYYVNNGGWTATLNFGGNDITIKDPGGTHTRFETNPVVLDMMYKGAKGKYQPEFDTPTEQRGPHQHSAK